MKYLSCPEGIREGSQSARRTKVQIEKMIIAGLVAAKEWGIDPLTVEIMLVPPEAGNRIVVSGRKPIKDNYITVTYPEDVVTLREWRQEKGVSVTLAYSETCNVLVVRVEEDE